MMRAEESNSSVIGYATFLHKNRELRLYQGGRLVLQGALCTEIKANQLPRLKKPRKPGEAGFQWQSTGLNIGHEQHGDIDTYSVRWSSTTDPDFPLRDEFQMAGAHWYGCGTVHQQLWPIEKWQRDISPFVSPFGYMIERYWLSSLGVAIVVGNEVPLFVGMNSRGNGKLSFLAQYNDSPYNNPKGRRPFLEYTVISGPSPLVVHKFAMKKFFCLPRGVPDERMFRSPVWSTWARYKVHVTQRGVLDYAGEISSHGFSNSQIEIDDDFTTKYGDFRFNLKKFPDAKGMVDQLKADDFRVTLWVHPFSNLDSQSFSEGREKGYFLGSHDQAEGGVKAVEWWNGSGAVVDVTNPRAREWYCSRLRDLQQESGIDSFKFDAGENLYLPPHLSAHQPMVNPSDFTTKYVQTVASFGPMVEVRVGYRNQDLPIFVRMMDKDSNWGYDNGLRTIIPSALTLSILGYPYILPDMIGGNAYEAGFHETRLPDRELFIRWAQVTAFLPAMQFSIAPWQYDEEVVQISKRYVELHENFVTPLVLKFAEEALRDGSPIIRPLWWLAPSDEQAHVEDSEFLIGDEVLVAPILDQGRTFRDVYLPPGGTWQDCRDDSVHDGGQTLRDVSVPLGDVAYYVRKG
ncbi:myogenesis-regulating glycosidase-like [Branchiostoma floridae x Branchiostoma belcheri]